MKSYNKLGPALKILIYTLYAFMHFLIYIKKETFEVNTIILISWVKNREPSSL